MNLSVPLNLSVRDPSRAGRRTKRIQPERNETDKKTLGYSFDGSTSRPGRTTDWQESADRCGGAWLSGMPSSTVLSSGVSPAGLSCSGVPFCDVLNSADYRVDQSSALPFSLPLRYRCFFSAPHRCSRADVPCGFVSGRRAGISPAAVRLRSSASNGLPAAFLSSSIWKAARQTRVRKPFWPRGFWPPFGPFRALLHRSRLFSLRLSLR
jgi:hypothetical protein